MIRGTTPVIRFDLPFSIDNVSVFYLTIAQDNMPVLTFDLSRVEETKNPGIYQVHLTQEETLQLKSGIATRLQIRLKSNFDDVIASKDIPFNVDRILLNGVI